MLRLKATQVRERGNIRFAVFIVVSERSERLSLS
jgi:hypothetical protein